MEEIIVSGCPVSKRMCKNTEGISDGVTSLFGVMHMSCL